MAFNVASAAHFGIAAQAVVSGALNRVAGISMYGTTSMTIGRMKDRVAARARLMVTDAGGTWKAPTDALGAARMQSAIEDGFAEFCDAYAWSWMKRRVKLTLSPDGSLGTCIDGSAWRYSLPAGIQSRTDTLTASVSYPGYRGGSVRITDLMGVEEMHAAYPDVSPAFPQVIGIGPGAVYADAPSSPVNADGRPAYELALFPPPDMAYVLTFEAQVRPRLSSNDADVGVWPAIHDMTVIACAVRALVREDRKAGSPEMAQAQAFVDERMGISIARDNDMAPVIREPDAQISPIAPKPVLLASDGSTL